MNISTPPESAITIVEPKSGSATASAMGSPMMHNARTAPFQNSSIRQPALSRKTAVAMTTAILANSLGWMRTGPNISQRREPLTGRNPKTAQSASTTTTYIAIVSQRLSRHLR